ncbi:phage tail tape measure protein [Citrobacter sp. FDAARGOS_156]|uniref:phage tail tape measure protein n=1 Tax=Citrobacter sp. FDAARGOS_156 TaxID=1702170 RepID=UPI0019072C09|nr:phage tail tape measure protein [Citrobacter sp. FDAARGOS_156]MBJ9640693.1 phage tail tape measure protein [Citrobacter sp. FDAARGOS_156]
MSEQTSRLAIIIDSTGAEKNAESLTSALHGLTEWGRKAAASTGKVTKATEEESAALSELLDRIDPVNAALNKLDKQQQLLAKFKSKGMLDDETFDVYSKKIEEARNRLAGFSDQLKTTGMSAKQTAFAMRMIPAQMTDIVVGLSTGQSPFMVLMQQGGQLKDMFGGIGPAIKGVGSYVMGLINPFTLAAAAVGVLGMAYYKGTQEQDAFNKSLILTGNQVGKTSGQLADVAARAGVAANSTTGAAASVLNQLVESGKVAGDSLERVTTAVVKTSEATGIATEQLVGDFNKITADPLDAITKLNDQYHFLTLSTYNQIKALQDEGNQQEAARIASEAYSSSLIQRSNQIKENLGTLETAWNALGKAAGWAWDAMLDVGREASVEQKIQDASSELERAQKSLADLERGQAANAGPYGAWKSNDIERDKKAIDLLKQRISTLHSEKTANDVINNSVDSYNRKQQESIKIQQEADRANQQFQTNADKRNKALEQQKKFLDAGAISADQYAKNVSRINEMYKDPKTPVAPKGKAVTEDAGQRMIDQLNQQNALLVTQAEETNKLSSSEQELIKWRQQLSTLETRSPSQLTTAQKSLLLRKDEITSLMERNAQQEKNNRLMKEATELASYRSTLEMGLDNLRASYAVQDSGFGLGEKQQKQMQELLQLEQKYNAQRQQLDRDYADKSKGMSEETYNAKSQMLTDALGRERAIMQQHYENLDAMNNDWLGGVEQGFRNWMDTASTYSTQMSGVVQGAMSGLVDTMADGLSGSKADWNEWSMSVLKSLQKVLLNAMIVNGIKSMQGAGIWGSLFGSANSGGSTPSGVYGSASSGLDFFKQNAKGGVYDSPSLSAYSGGVFDSPKLFAFAKGAGVFGEAGPEAIMPLARTPDGNLGVRMMGEQGGGFSGDIIVQQTIHVSGNGDAALNRAMEDAARKGASDGARQARQEMLQDFQNRGQGRRLLGV